MREMDTVFRHVRRQLNAEWHRISAESIGDIADNGLSFTHGRLVVNIAEKGPLKSSEAADLLGITNGAVTGIVDKLIELGYMERKRSETDRRIVMLHITHRAKGLICEIDRVRDRIMMKLFRNLTDEEIDFAIRLFRKMSGNLEAD